MTKRPAPTLRYVLTLAPSPSPVAPLIRLRAALKVLARRFGLRCIGIRRVSE